MVRSAAKYQQEIKPKANHIESRLRFDKRCRDFKSAALSSNIGG